MGSFIRRRAGDRTSRAQARPPARARRRCRLLLIRFSLHIPFGKKRGAKLVDPPQALFDLIPQGDGVVLFKQIQKPLPLSRFEVDPGQGSAARAAGSLLVVTLDLAVGLTLRGDPEGKHLPGKPFAARLSGQEPDVLEHRDILRRVTARGRAMPRWVRSDALH